MTDQTIAKTVICVRCKWHRQNGTIWYHHYCLHPSVERAPSIDPVTGDKGYECKNDLGGRYYTDERYPNCRDINDGTCKLWKQRR